MSLLYNPSHALRLNLLMKQAATVSWRWNQGTMANPFCVSNVKCISSLRKWWSAEEEEYANKTPIKQLYRAVVHDHHGDQRRKKK